MLLLTRGKISEAVAYEVQEYYAHLIERNAEHNRLSDKLRAVCTDVRELRACEECDVVFTNPPYMKATGGKNNERDEKAIARHEICGTIDDFCIAAKKLLKYGGAFCAVYRPDRLADLICAMRSADIEPKRATFVHADTESEASMVLIEGKRGGKSGMTLTRPLIIYTDRTHREYAEDMKYIMENGSFPSEYKR